jgi:multicomponent Na+:H+ antiporter subunit D
MVSSLLNVAYLLPIPVRGFYSKPDGDDDAKTGIHEAPLLCVLPLCATALGGLVLFFWADHIYHVLQPISLMKP